MRSTVDTGKRENPNYPQRLRTRVVDRDPFLTEGIMASGSCTPHQKAGHMAAPTSLAAHQLTLANGEPSTHGVNETFWSGCRLSPTKQTNWESTGQGNF